MTVAKHVFSNQSQRSDVVSSGGFIDLWIVQVKAYNQHMTSYSISLTQMEGGKNI